MHFLEGRWKLDLSELVDSIKCSALFVVPLRFTEWNYWWDIVIKMSISVKYSKTMKENFPNFTLPWWRSDPAIKPRTLRSFLSSAVGLRHRWAAALFSRRHARSRDLAKNFCVLYSDPTVHVDITQNYAKISEHVLSRVLIVQAWTLAWICGKCESSKDCFCCLSRTHARFIFTTDHRVIQGHRPTLRGIQVSGTRSVDSFKRCVQYALLHDCVTLACAFQLQQQDEDNRKHGGKAADSCDQQSIWFCTFYCLSLLIFRKVGFKKRAPFPKSYCHNPKGSILGFNTGYFY